MTLYDAVKKHYPLIAGRVILLQQSGEWSAAQTWAECAKDLHKAMDLFPKSQIEHPNDIPLTDDAMPGPDHPGFGDAG